MKLILLILLVVVAFVMIYLGESSGNLPPAITGIGFIIVATLFVDRAKKN